MATHQDLIDRSVAQSEIVHAAWTAELAHELSIESDDSAETDGAVEYWGTREDGAEWRVHLDREGDAEALLDAALATMPTVSDEQIEALREEAGEAGDRIQVELCRRALEGDEAARAECARVIADAAAQAQD